MLQCACLSSCLLACFVLNCKATVYGYWLGRSLARPFITRVNQMHGIRYTSTLTSIIATITTTTDPDVYLCRYKYSFLVFSKKHIAIKINHRRSEWRVTSDDMWKEWWAGVSTHILFMPPIKVISSICVECASVCLLQNRRKIQTHNYPTAYLERVVYGTKSTIDKSQTFHQSIFFVTLTYQYLYACYADTHRHIDTKT